MLLAIFLMSHKSPPAHHDYCRHCPSRLILSQLNNPNDVTVNVAAARDVGVTDSDYSCHKGLKNPANVLNTIVVGTYVISAIPTGTPNNEPITSRLTTAISICWRWRITTGIATISPSAPIKAVAAFLNQSLLGPIMASLLMPHQTQKPFW